MPPRRSPQFEKPFDILFFVVGGLCQDVSDLKEPSFLACLEKQVLRWRAWDSPQNAPAKFFSVQVPLLLAAGYPPLVYWVAWIVMVI
jgi:hypothetical protein